MVACGGYRAVSAGSSWCRWSCHAPTPPTGFGVPIPARYFQQARHVMRAARRHRHSPGFHLWQTQKDHFSSINNRETEPGFRLCRSSLCMDSARRPSVLGASTIVASSVPPARRDARKDHANEDDLNPDEPAELSENDFDAIAPGGSQSVADRLYAIRRSSQPPLDPVRPVIKRHSDENPCQDSGDDSKTVYFDRARICAGSDRSILSRIGWGAAHWGHLLSTRDNDRRA